MLIVAATVQIQPDKIDEAISAMQEMAEATQSEDGCIRYQFYQDIQEPTTFLAYEEWRDDAALAAHNETPHMAVLQSKMPGIVVGPVDVKRYEVGESN